MRGLKRPAVYADPSKDDPSHKEAASAAMVLTKIAIVAAAIAGLLGLAKNQMWFERAGLLAECEVVQAPYGERPGGQWWLCRAGVLSGLPNLSRDHCESKRITGQSELWRCPNAIDNPA